jgi:hypothetical protein
VPSYPLDTASRARVRNELEQRVYEEMRRQLAAAGRTLNCAVGNHRKWNPVTFTWDGCQNTGESCICECHDDQDVSGGVSAAQ